MISVSNDYKTALTQPRTIDAKITYGNSIITSDDINSISRSFNSDLFKTIAKQVSIDSNTPIAKDIIINPQFGLYVNDNFEYLSLGYYKIKDNYILNKDTNSYQITAYDKIIESMIEYGLTESDITYPCTVRQLFVAIFTKLGWTTSGIPNSFVNSTSSIEEDVYSNVGFTYRDVLDELCTISCMFLIDINGTPTLKQKTTTSEIINEDFMKDTSVKVENQVFFNSLVFSRASESDNIYRKDDTSIANNGLHEFKVSDLQILSMNWRDNFIDEMWNYIKTFNYYAFDIDTIGITYLEPIDTFTISTFGSTYSTILLNSDLIIANGVNEKIYANEPLESETEYKYADETDRKINQTYIIVNKQQGQIDAVVSQVDEIEQDIQNPTSTKENKYFDLEDALDEPLIDFSLYGETQQDSTTGKNLIGTFIQGGLNNGVPTGATNRIRTDYIEVSSNDKYTFSNNNDKVDQMGLSFYDTNKDFISAYSGGGWVGFNQTITMLSNAKYIIAVFRKTTNVGLSPTDNYKIQMEKGTTATSYEPYTGGSSAPSPSYPFDIHNVSGDNTIEICGKNLVVPFSYSRTNNGLDFTYNLDGSITVDKTSTGTAYAIANADVSTFTTLPAGTYTLSGGTNGIPIRFDDSTGTNIANTTSSTQFTLNQETKGYIQLRIGRGKTFNNVKVYPMIEKGSTATEYEAYTGNSQLISLGSIELNKISTYQDYIYKENDRWYLHKEIGKVVFTGAESETIEQGDNSSYSNSILRFNIAVSDKKLNLSDSAVDNILCNRFTAKKLNYDARTQESIAGHRNDKAVIIFIDSSRLGSANVTGFKTWLSTHNTIVYYALAKPIDIPIEDWSSE